MTFQPSENEMMLHVPAEHRARLLGHLAPRGALLEGKHEVTTYFDTPDLVLAQAGFSLRVRRSGGLRVQTASAVEGWYGLEQRRSRWEWPIEHDAPDLGLLAGTLVPDGIVGQLNGRLEPVFVTDIRRTAYGLRLGRDIEVAAALDQGSITAGTTTELISELELGLTKGAPGPFYRFVLELHATIPLTILGEGKAERGQRMRTGVAVAAHKSTDMCLSRDADVAGAFRQVAEDCLGHLVANQAAAFAGSFGGVHQMRVALRRLRSALVLFDKHLKRGRRKQLDAGLQRFGRVLGEMRDWDVFCLETLPAATAAKPGEDWAGLRKAAEAERQAAYVQLRDELAGRITTEFMLTLAAESAAEPATSALVNRSGHRSLLEQAPKMLDRVAHKVTKGGRGLKHQSEQDLHELRKSLKKLRYSVDFFGGLYDYKQVRVYVQHCKGLQEELGAMNDASVAVSLTQKLSRTDPARLSGLAEKLLHWTCQSRDGALSQLANGWHEFKGAAPFWK
jgi:triphosphatase